MARSVKWRKVLLVLGIVVGVAAIGGTTATILAYNEATKIDRSNPKVVLDEYLRASLVRADSVGVDLYACEREPDLSTVTSLREELTQREQKFAVEIEVTWGSIDLKAASTTAVATTDLAITARKQGAVESRSRETWQFTLVDEEGWRVCKASRMATPTSAPTPSPSAG
ncbi:hypothetical protein ACFQO7_14145 [Catellatospora aurea]|uniref:Mce-associated membrane protein n=1 Tax=Catellatospora aurea TaxID=1337874 RepID=A0ABW2GZ07_9ACTN